MDAVIRYVALGDRLLTPRAAAGVTTAILVVDGEYPMVWLYRAWSTLITDGRRVSAFWLLCVVLL